MYMCWVVYVFNTSASARASSTSEPVLRTLMALTEEERRLDWLIPKLDPAENWDRKL